MIDIKKLTEKDIGRWVEYTCWVTYIKEIGRVKSYNKKYVFVVYKCGNKWYRFKDFTGVATNPKYLEFVEK